MTQFVVDILLLGFFAFVALRIKASQRSIRPATAPSAPLERRPEPFRRTAPPELYAEGEDEDEGGGEDQEVEPAPAGLASPAPRYLLGGRRTTAGVDTVAATLAHMSGPGICTPRDP